ncbi:MAG TPA: SdrD B-like domain-containing protein, partial [Candidatus Krumholzibacteria bacterium]|nr:SdrD B-like domain-containing protein [Candidatus Krumholzibacteria bacterium]
MRRSPRFLLLCTIAALTAGCSDTNQPTSTTPNPQTNFALSPMGEGCASIGDRVWLDENCNGIQDKRDDDSPEVGVAGVVVELYTCDGSLVASTTTDATGYYLFEGLDEYGQFKVCFVLPDGYSFTKPNQGTSEGLDSDAGDDGCSDCIDFVDCKPIRYVDAGLCRDESTGCRVTGGGVDEFGNWDGSTTNGRCHNDRYTFGGQAGANTALPPQPAGEWEHNNHSGPSGSFAFHGGTHSAPDGTEIDRIECSDAGFCDPARHAPAKQIDFWGVGMFHNARNLSPILAANVVVSESLHWFEVNIDDGGEPGRGKGG